LRICLATINSCCSFRGNTLFFRALLALFNLNIRRHIRFKRIIFVDDLSCIFLFICLYLKVNNLLTVTHVLPHLELFTFLNNLVGKCIQPCSLNSVFKITWLSNFSVLLSAVHQRTSIDKWGVCTSDNTYWCDDIIWCMKTWIITLLVIYFLRVSYLLMVLWMRTSLIWNITAKLISDSCFAIIIFLLNSSAFSSFRITFIPYTTKWLNLLS